MNKYYDKYGSDYKSLTFMILDKRHVDLRIRLRHDGLTQQNFFTTFIQMYLDNDESALGLVEKIKKSTTSRGKNRRQKTRNLIEKGKEIQKQFALSDEDLEDIFDMIAQEHGEI